MAPATNPEPGRQQPDAADNAISGSAGCEKTIDATHTGLRTLFRGVVDDFKNAPSLGNL
jgi:hypothetical protein